MKKVAYLLSFFLILFWASAGFAVAQPLSELTGPLDKVVDKVSNPVDKVKDVVDKVKQPIDKTVSSLPDPIKKPLDKTVSSLPNPIKKPVDNVTKEVEKVIDKVVNDVGEVAKDPAGAAGAVGDKTKPAPALGSAPASAQSKPGSSAAGNSASGASATKTKVARTTKQSSKAKRANRADPARDTEQVAASGHTIEPAEVKGTQIIAPATDDGESEGSGGLSLTGVQILTWLMLACWLVGMGAAIVWRGRTQVRAVSS